jgi:uncharacterized protein YggE
MSKIVRPFLGACAFALLAIPTWPQDTSKDRTIRVQATETISVPAEIATVKVGYTNTVATRDAAYNENVRISKKILQSLVDAGIPAAAIETQSISLEKQDEHRPDGSTRTIGFAADQDWHVHVAAAEAQKTIDVAVAAGVNEIEGVDWNVKDAKALEEKAYSAAMDRAKSIANQSAAHMGVKLGQIISIENGLNRSSFPLETLNSEIVSVADRIAVSSVPLTLYAPKIERQASVSVVYAIVE